LVDYANASTLTENDLDDDSLQAFYMAQEAIDTAATALGIGSNEIWDAATLRIENVVDPTAAQDAATKAYVDAASIASGNVPTPSNPSEDNYILSASGGTFAWEAMVAADIPNDLIDSQHIAAGALDNEHYAVNSIDGTHIALGSDAQGDVMYYDGTNWVRLAKGTADQVLAMNSGATAPEWVASGGLLRVQDTEKSTTSGTSKSWTIPAGISVVEKIEICFDGLSLDGTDQLLVQIGNSTVETSGYFSTSADTVTEVHSTAGFVLRTVAAATLGGLLTLTHFGGNQWVYAGAGANQSNNSVTGGGSKGALSGVLDIVTLKPSGSDNFDAGVANVIWYGS
jgi:hypothetical protein